MSKKNKDKNKDKSIIKISDVWFGIFLLVSLIIFGVLIYCNNLTKDTYALNYDENLLKIREFHQQQVEKFPRRIDGTLILDKEKTNLWPVAIMIDNMVDARPPVGLSKANLVIESLAEANITRFLAIFASGEKIKKIGPVRSARPYFLEWAEELKALYVHSGGSPEALKKIRARQYDVYDLNEFYFGKYFWRDNLRSRPHNLFTSSKLLDDALEMKGVEGEKPVYESWIFKNDKLSNVRKNSNQSIKSIKIIYSKFNHLVGWKYDFNNNEYVRYQSGKKHLDEDGSEIKAKNIIIQRVKMKILDEVGRKEIITTGSGEAVIFQDGKVIQGYWKKTEKGRRTKFFDTKNNEIKFNRGTSWIEIVPVNYKIEY